MPQSTDESLRALREKGLSAHAGRYSYGVPQVSWAAGDTRRRLSIGSFCSIAAGVLIYVGMQGRHTTDFLSTYPISMIFGQPAQKDQSEVLQGTLDVVIGSDVWLGRACTVLAGASIGDGAVLGTGSIITKDVPPYAIFVGNPARHIRNRFPDDVIELLLEKRWWDWPDEKIAQHRHVFFKKDFVRLLRDIA